jgi:hypothetical protein
MSIWSVISAVAVVAAANIMAIVARGQLSYLISLSAG